MKADVKTMVAEEKKSQFTALISGVLIAFAITCTVFIVYALLLTYTSVTEANISMIVTITSIVSVIVAGYDAAKGAENRGWLWGIIAGLIYGVILLVIKTWVLKAFSMDARAVTLIILSIAGGGLGGVIGINITGKKKGKIFAKP